MRINNVKVFCFVSFSFIHQKVMSKQNQLKNRVYKFWENNKLRGKRYVANHFLAENKSETITYRLIPEAENGMSI